jgi:hypothetical protein
MTMSTYPQAPDPEGWEQQFESLCEGLQRATIISPSDYDRIKSFIRTLLRSERARLVRGPSVDEVEAYAIGQVEERIRLWRMVEGMMWDGPGRSEREVEIHNQALDDILKALNR